jgi:excisionase family DNA binding protein
MTRTVLHDAAEVPDDMLTTGEAAKLLNSSRQHVVNLCRQGVLPYTSIGTHRRVRRQDLEALKNRTERLRREDRRSLWLAYATAGKIVSDPPAAVERARQQIALMRPTVRGQARLWIDEWSQLLDGPVEALLTTLTDPSLRGREMRQNSPFAGLLTDEERAAIITHWREHSSKQ